MDTLNASQRGALLQARTHGAAAMLADMRHLAMRRDMRFWYDGGGKPNLKLYRRVSQILDPTAPLTVAVVFDYGHHVSGWFRNSDYDRCLHLSRSAPEPGPPVSLLRVYSAQYGHPVSAGFMPIPQREVELWTRLCFGEHVRWVWHESGQYVRHVVHLRLFHDRDNQPVFPLGEVYHLKPWADRTSPEKVFRS